MTNLFQGLKEVRSKAPRSPRPLLYHLLMMAMMMVLMMVPPPPIRNGTHGVFAVPFPYLHSNQMTAHHLSGALQGNLACTSDRQSLLLAISLGWSHFRYGSSEVKPILRALL